MINEIQVIKAGGIPLYHYASDESDDDLKILQASFFTAISSFATELQNGEMKLIVMDKKSYLLRRESNYTIIFASLVEDHEDNIKFHETDLLNALSYFGERVQFHKVSPDTLDIQLYDQPLTDFDKYLKENELIPKDMGVDVPRFRTGISNAIFKSVGYEPGVCNIGRAERFRRLSFGMTWLVISFGIYFAIEALNLNNYFKIVLVIPNFLGFLGVLQYFYRFCTTNAMKEIYNMN